MILPRLCRKYATKLRAYAAALAGAALIFAYRCVMPALLFFATRTNARPRAAIGAISLANERLAVTIDADHIS